eukprot:gb/GFBE01032260.1/.p1 GENE.gb/GFBE01032260.1/~~gb/GFBE01032260.1/.p1  ORF type:complete len:252 (+),score=30.17 gb/GFBE01032260.1/:1-756(+)
MSKHHRGHGDEMSNTKDSLASSLKKEFPKLNSLSHVRRSPRWTFNSGRASEHAERKSAQAPGPGTYALNSPDVTSRHQKGPTFSFGSAGRGMVGAQKSPGPGTYSMTKEPGSTTAAWTMTPRREEKRLADSASTPGPGEHSIKAMLGLGHAPGYTAGKRLNDMDPKSSPGPGDYTQVDAVGNKSPSWGFGSSNRPDNGNSAQLATPGPGAYMVASTVGGGPTTTLKGRHPGPRPQAMPGPGTHGGHYSSFS